MAMLICLTAVIFVACLFGCMAFLVILQSYNVVDLKNSSTFFLFSIITAIAFTLVIVDQVLLKFE